MDKLEVRGLRGLLPPDQMLAGGFILALVLAWLLASFSVPDYILPDPLPVLKLTGQLFVDPDLFGHTYVSFARVVGAVALAVVLAGCLMALSHMIPITSTLINGRLTPLLNAFPTLGWAFMAIFWFGISTTSVIFVEVAILLPFCIINLAAGLQALDQELLEMAQSLTRTRWRIMFKVAFPMVTPYILAAVRVSYGVAWKVALIAELFGANKGLGYLLNSGRTQFDSTTIFATIVAIIILVFAVDRLVLDSAERYAYRYKSQAA